MAKKIILLSDALENRQVRSGVQMSGVHFQEGALELKGSSQPISDLRRRCRDIVL